MSQLDRRRGPRTTTCFERSLVLRVDPFRRGAAHATDDMSCSLGSSSQYSRFLVGAKGGVVSAEELLERAWDENAGPVHERRAHYSLSATQAPWRALDHRDRGRRRRTASHPPHMPARTGQSVVDTAPGLKRSPQTHAQSRRLLSRLWAPCCSVQSGCSCGQDVPRGEIVIVHGTQVLVSPGRGASSLATSFDRPPPLCWPAPLLFGSPRRLASSARGMLTPLARITDAHPRAASGSLSHRIRLAGRADEFHELGTPSMLCWRGSQGMWMNSRGSRPMPPTSYGSHWPSRKRFLEVARDDPDRGTMSSSTASSLSTRGLTYLSPKHCSTSAGPMMPPPPQPSTCP